MRWILRALVFTSGIGRVACGGTKVQFSKLNFLSKLDDAKELINFLAANWMMLRS